MLEESLLGCLQYHRTWVHSTVTDRAKRFGVTPSQQ